MVRVFIVFFALAAPTNAQDAAVGRGEQVFVAQKCSICHAIADNGNKKGPLDNVGAKLSGDELRQWIVNAPEMAAKTGAQRKPAMKVFGNIPVSDIDDLVTYLQTLKKK